MSSRATWSPTASARARRPRPAKQGPCRYCGKPATKVEGQYLCTGDCEQRWLRATGAYDKPEGF
jgi:hypothetical protein